MSKLLMPSAPEVHIGLASERDAQRCVFCTSHPSSVRHLPGTTARPATYPSGLGPFLSGLMFYSLRLSCCRVCRYQALADTSSAQTVGCFSWLWQQVLSDTRFPCATTSPVLRALLSIEAVGGASPTGAEPSHILFLNVSKRFVPHVGEKPSRTKVVPSVTLQR